MLGEAQAAGLSLNQFILREYRHIAGRARNSEIFARAAGRSGQRLRRDDIVATLREIREDGEEVEEVE